MKVDLAESEMHPVEQWLIYNQAPEWTGNLCKTKPNFFVPADGF